MPVSSRLLGWVNLVSMWVKICGLVPLSFIDSCVAFMLANVGYMLRISLLTSDSLSSDSTIDMMLIECLFLDFILMAEFLSDVLRALELRCFFLSTKNLSLVPVSSRMLPSMTRLVFGF